MSVDFSKVRVGDRVRLTKATTGDEVTFTVTERYGHRVNAKANSFHTDDWDALEILPRSLPTRPGFYAIEPVRVNRGAVLALVGSHWLRIPLFLGGCVELAEEWWNLEDNTDRLTYLGGLPEKAEDNA